MTGVAAELLDERRSVSGPRHVLRVAAATLRAELQARTAYRAQLAIGALGWVVPLAFMALWRGAAADGALGGITQAQLTTYFAMMLVVSNLWISGDIIFGVSSQIHDGRLAALLLRPVPPVLPSALAGLASNAYRVPVVLVGVPLVIGLGGGTVTRDPGRWVLALVVGTLGIVSVAYVAAMVATVALWLTKAEGVQGLVFGLEWVVGGMVAPVALLPGILPELLVHQPFWYAGGAAPEIVAGMGEHSWWLVAECAAWVLGLHLLCRAVWRRGMRRFEAVGS